MGQIDKNRTHISTNMLS